MRAVDVSTQKMMEEYCHLHFDLGKTPKEIAKMFKLSYTCVLNHLDEIARENGCSRIELLEDKSRSGERSRYCGRLKTAEPLDLKQLKQEVDDALAAVSESLTMIDGFIKNEQRKK